MTLVEFINKCGLQDKRIQIIVDGDDTKGGEYLSMQSIIKYNPEHLTEYCEVEESWKSYHKVCVKVNVWGY